MTWKVNGGYYACKGYVRPALARFIMIRTGEWRAKKRQKAREE